MSPRPRCRPRAVDNIIVNIPKGTNTDQAVKQVGTTAQLYFRPVLTEAAGSPAPASTPSPSVSPSTGSSAKPSGSPAPGSKSTGGKAKATATPSAGATAQGRPVTDALKAGASGAPTAPAVAAPTPASPSAPAKPGGIDLSTSPALQKQFTALDCADKKQKANAGLSAKPTEPTVACSQDGTGQVPARHPPRSPARTSPAPSRSTTRRAAPAGSSPWASTPRATASSPRSPASSPSSRRPNNEFAIVLDNQVVSSPSVSSAITGGQAQISGNFTQQSSSDLANVLSYGALPLSFVTSDVTTVSPQLGGEQLHGGLIAGAVGLVLVVLYLLAYYRGLSFVAVASAW